MEELERVIKEGWFDKIKGTIGTQTGTEYRLIPKEQWINLLKNRKQLVDMLANTPEIKDTANLVTDILEQLSDSGSMEAKKIQQQIRQSIRNKDKKALIELIRGIQQEADRIRTVRTHMRDDIQKIAQTITEDIKSNNGLLLD
jgi:hypothetical protein